MAKAALKTKSGTSQPHTGIDPKQLGDLADGLRKAVADTYVLLVKTQAYHWNVVGPLFVSIHELTEKQYEELFTAADELSERIRALGKLSPMSFAEMTKDAGIAEHDAGTVTAEDMVSTLAADHAAVAKRMRKVANHAEELGDLVTNDMLIGRMTFHEKAAWMLRAIIAS